MNNWGGLACTDKLKSSFDQKMMCCYYWRNYVWWFGSGQQDCLPLVTEPTLAYLRCYPSFWNEFKVCKWYVAPFSSSQDWVASVYMNEWMNF